MNLTQVKSQAKSDCHMSSACVQAPRAECIDPDTFVPDSQIACVCPLGYVGDGAVNGTGCFVTVMCCALRSSMRACMYVRVRVYIHACMTTVQQGVRMSGCTRGDVQCVVVHRFPRICAIFYASDFLCRFLVAAVAMYISQNAC